MKKINLTASKREATGKSSTKKVRNEKMVPCNLYGGSENMQFTLPLIDAKKAIYTDEFIHLSINVSGVEKNVIVKELQFHPISNELIHIDFQELVAGKVVKTEIPLIVKGFSKGQQIGGKLEIKVRKLKVQVESTKIPNSIEIDVTELELGKSLRVRDIVAMEGVTFLNPPSIPIVTISIPRALRSQQAAAANG
ncbi:MAG: 50S ribosomal protein L25 [Chitinophagales bacterium]|nr:50S ribosomal protein L25 [Chitinophagales bacterium]